MTVPSSSSISRSSAVRFNIGVEVRNDEVALTAAPGAAPTTNAEQVELIARSSTRSMFFIIVGNERRREKEGT
eukprot:CAMPEP_0115852506 /NCGR_PEP_ID=MMETSP0287-20121206/13033_1 /TAXON_ID=412157 /ORGANISM="Chrysochromulina rotalis, Strain UIO044" /LENGTH=72 /DNA_ID=CAMNT_0003306573 /DNA_START=535 /DNA_END=753 /DNA_ORIENTATION=-